jgi:hypothetical protein
VLLSISVIGAHADHYRLELFGTDGTVIGDDPCATSDTPQDVPT